MLILSWFKERFLSNTSYHSWVTRSATVAFLPSASVEPTHSLRGGVRQHCCTLGAFTCVCVCSRLARWVVGIDHLHTQTHFHTKFSHWDVERSFSVPLILPDPLLSPTRRSTALGLSLCGTGRRRDIWRICRGEWGSVLYWRSQKGLKPGSRGLMLIPWPFYQGLHFTLKLPLPCGSPLRSAVKFPPLGLKVIMAWYPPRMLNDRDTC